MLDPSLTTALSSACETAVNAALRYDPASKNKIASIQDILAIHCTHPKISLYCRGSDKGVRIQCHCDEDITTSITGSLPDLLLLLQEPTTLSGSDVDLSGKVPLLQKWQQVLKQLDIDLEGAMSDVIGDIAAPIAADAIYGSFKWFFQQKKECERLSTEYLVEELKLLPSKVEMEDLTKQARQLVEDIDRLETKINNFTHQQDKNP